VEQGGCRLPEYGYFPFLEIVLYNREISPVAPGM